MHSARLRSGPSGSVSSQWRMVPLALAIVALIGSVAIPARQTWLITDLLRETTDVLAPARLLQGRAQSGLAEELVTLQGYAISGDPALLRHYRAIAEEDDRILEQLEIPVRHLGSPASANLATARRAVAEWRMATGVLLDEQKTGSDIARGLNDEQSGYFEARSAIRSLSANLFVQTAERDDRVRTLEHWSLIANAVLVLAAFAALVGVAILTVRERRALHEARHRAQQEAELREAAEALAGAFTIDDVTELIAGAAMKAMEGRGAFVEQIVDGPDGGTKMIVVRALAGTGVPPLERACEFAGSYTERVMATGQPALIDDLANAQDAGIGCTLHGTSGSAIVIPLAARGTPVGALYVVSSVSSRFRADDVARAAIFSHLAALAYEKVRLLEEAYEGRRTLERVIKSRSRLIRGFSHDVKNPIGAADGYAALLADGILGELSPKQDEGVKRIRRGIHTALTLIDDLHELGRAETGHLALSSEEVDLGSLVSSLCEEYQASAYAKGLMLCCETRANPPPIRTSMSRVRQIVSNLLSNAIKYTDSGSVSVHVRTHQTGPFGEQTAWVLVEIIDTGRGIPADRREFIFEEFSRIGDNNKPGAGLGLAISRLVAQALGGQISVDSEPGRGSTFTLWLPVERSP